MVQRTSPPGGAEGTQTRSLRVILALTCGNILVRGAHPGNELPRAKAGRDWVRAMTWGNMLEQWTLTQERGYWRAKAGSFSRNRVYPDSHPGISGVIGTLT